MVYCCVPLCTSNSNRSMCKGIPFHEFPLDEELSAKWVKNIPRRDWKPKDTTRICGLHFAPEDYKTGLKIKKLNPGAVPTIFKTYPSYKQTSIQSTLHKRHFNTNSHSQMDRKHYVPEGQQQMLTHQELATEMLASWEAGTSLKVSDARHKPLPRPESAHMLVSHGTSAQHRYMDRKPSLHKRSDHPSSATLDGRPSTKPLDNELYEIMDRRIRAEKAKQLKQKIKIERLERELQVLRSTSDQTKKLDYLNAIESIYENANNGDEMALFLRQQIKAYKQERVEWDERVLQHCILWRSRSPTGYEFPKEANLLKLPSCKTLNRYIGDQCSDIGVAPFIRERLMDESEQIDDGQKHSNLIFHEMKVTPTIQQLLFQSR